MNTGISVKKRNIWEISGFLGVDFSSSVLDVRQNRASYMKNLINDGGMTVKRPGWNQIVKITHNGEATQINGIFEYINGSCRETIVHAGRRFYRLTGDFAYEDITPSSTYANAAIDIGRITDTRSSAFFAKDRMYITGCGDYLVYGTWDEGKNYELRRVYDNEDTYIPTTTISIDVDGADDSARAMLDDVNCMSPRRKNQLIGPSADSGLASIWTVDTRRIDAGSDITIEMESTNLNATEVHKYIIRNSGDDKSVLWVTKKDDEDVSLYQCGSVDFANGKITLEDVNTYPPIEGRDNITVTFCYANADYESRIAKCGFGALFGAEGNSDRLFLSGNADLPNVDFYSEADDLTYFPDRNTGVMGSDNVPIMGYARISDGTLVIYKAENDREATVYYRNGRYVQEDDESGINYIKTVFSTSAASIGEGAVSRYAFANLAGDNIMLSSNGIFGIVLSDNVTTTERYARERSRNINKKLCGHKELAEAYGFVYRNKYYLSIDGVCYIADARYKYSAQDDIDGSYNYEWWYWDGIPARVFASLNGALYFGTPDGMVCVFDDKYSDRTHMITDAGDLALDTSAGNIIYNAGMDVDIAVGDRISFKNAGIYARMPAPVVNAEGRIQTMESNIDVFHEGDEVYADNCISCNLKVNTKYYIADVDRSEYTYALVDENGATVSITGSGFRLLKCMDGKQMYIARIEDGAFYLSEYSRGEEITISGYNGTTPTLPIAIITRAKNVVSEWHTPMTDLGTAEYAKTLLSMTLVYEPYKQGRMTFGYETQSGKKLMLSRSRIQFSAEDISFTSFSFDTGFASSYTRRCNERNFNFIIFRFISDDDKCCAVNGFSAAYKINKTNRGVR